MKQNRLVGILSCFR